MKEYFITYEQSIELNKLGFNQLCFKIGNPNGHIMWKFMDVYELEGVGVDDVLSRKFDDRFVEIPTTQQALKFFRDKYNLYSTINVDRTMEPKFCYSIYEYNLKKYSDGWHVNVFNSDLYYHYEEAESAAIDKLIEIVKNEI
jgi:hypothetical protein